jgi:hypothetical protein
VKWKDTKDICFIKSTHDEELVHTRVPSQHIRKPREVINYNSMMAGVDMTDAFLMSYHRRLKKYYQKHFCYLIGICCLSSYLLY